MKTFREFCKEVYDPNLTTRRVGGEGGRVGKERKKSEVEKRRMKAVGGGKMEPAKDYKPRKDIGQQKGEKGSAPGRPAAGKDGEASTALKAGTAGTLGSAKLTPRERQRKAREERLARQSGKSQPKTASQAISQAKPKEEKPKAKPRRQWRTADGGGMTRQERDKARNAEKTAAAQKTAKSAKEILAQMRSDYEKKGGKWNSKVAVQMRAKAKKAAQALGN